MSMLLRDGPQVARAARRCILRACRAASAAAPPRLPVLGWNCSRAASVLLAEAAQQQLLGARARAGPPRRRRWDRDPPPLPPGRGAAAPGSAPASGGRLSSTTTVSTRPAALGHHGQARLRHQFQRRQRGGGDQPGVEARRRGTAPRSAPRFRAAPPPPPRPRFLPPRRLRRSSSPPPIPRRTARSCFIRKRTSESLLLAVGGKLVEIQHRDAHAVVRQDQRGAAPLAACRRPAPAARTCAQQARPGRSTLSRSGETEITPGFERRKTRSRRAGQCAPRRCPLRTFRRLAPAADPCSKPRSEASRDISIRSAFDEGDLVDLLQRGDALAHLLQRRTRAGTSCPLRAPRA